MKNAQLAEKDDTRPGLLPGLKAYDADGMLLGTVESIDQRLGTMRVATNPFFEEPLTVGLALITAMNARELYVSRTRRELASNGTRFHDPAGGDEGPG